MADKGNIRTYQFTFNGRRKHIDASTYSEARRKFQEKMGFFPSENLVDIQILEEEA